MSQLLQVRVKNAHSVSFDKHVLLEGFRLNPEELARTLKGDVALLRLFLSSQFVHGLLNKVCLQRLYSGQFVEQFVARLVLSP